MSATSLFRFHIDRQVFIPAIVILSAIVAFAALAPDTAGHSFKSMQTAIVTYFSWYYVLVAAIILVTMVIITFSRLGDIKLGPDHATPDYSFLSWFAMLFSAGMGIALMFFGVAEPITHFMSPPVGTGGTSEAAATAMKLTFFHWGLHGWAMYAIVALILAYFSFRHELPLTLRSSLYPLIGDRIYGPAGAMIDVFAILGTVCGVATSLGLGVLQINSGLAYLFDVPVNFTVQIVLIVITIGLATASVLLGLDVGIKRLSELNIVLAVLLLGFVLLLGPTVYLLQTFMQNTGGYLSDLVYKTFDVFAYQPTEWFGNWTIFYWGWWLSWAPFVGIFIARISRGRTIREFVLGAMLGPTLFTLLWMTVFGNSGIDLILNHGATELATAVQADSSTALFRFLDYFPYSHALSLLSVVMIMVFFVTSADSGAMVVNMLSAHGEDDTPLLQRSLWTVVIGTIAVVLLWAGGLSSLQSATIASALPFSIALLFAIWGFCRALNQDAFKQESKTCAVTLNTDAPWQDRLDILVNYPTELATTRGEQKKFLAAMKAVSDQLSSHGLSCEVTQNDLETRLVVNHDEEMDFIYAVVMSESELPGEGITGPEVLHEAEAEKYFRAEVHLKEGGQNYDVMGWGREQLIGNILDQYEQHLIFLHSIR